MTSPRPNLWHVTIQLCASDADESRDTPIAITEQRERKQADSSRRKEGNKVIFTAKGTCQHSSVYWDCRHVGHWHVSKLSVL
jgi:hypothetical protein